MLAPSTYLKICLAAAAMALITACAPPTYAIKTPPVTGLKYASTGEQAKTQISVIDERPNKQFSSGRLPADLIFEKAPVDHIQFLTKHLAAELKSRGLNADSIVGDNGQPKVHVKTFKMINHRVNAYTSFYTFTYLGADLESSNGNKRIGIFVQGDKVPVWSFDEVVEPIFNQPMGIIVQEFSSKVANQLFNYRASDDQVTALIGRIADSNSKTRYMDTYALGFTNNPAAIEKLVTLTKDKDDYVRLAAISSLGMLKATEQLPMLKAMYEKPNGLWQERAMAIKAIGDMDTEETKAYLTAQMKNLESAAPTPDNNRIAQLIGLYLR
jgi:hypothetical protein